MRHLDALLHQLGDQGNIRQKLKLTLREYDKETNDKEEEHEAISGVSKIDTSNNVPLASEAVTALRSLQCACVDCYIQASLFFLRFSQMRSVPRGFHSFRSCEGQLLKL